MSNHLGLILVSAGDLATGASSMIMFLVYGGKGSSAYLKNLYTEGSIGYGGNVTVSNVNDKIVITTTNSVAQFIALYF